MSASCQNIVRAEGIVNVIADQAVIERLGQPALDDMCRHLTSQLSKKDPAVALCSTIESLGARLAIELPRATDDVNELGDSLVLID